MFCNAFLESYKKLTNEKKIINKIKGVILVYLDTKINLDICINEFSSSNKEIIILQEKQKQKEKEKEKEQKEKKMKNNEKNNNEDNSEDNNEDNKNNDNEDNNENNEDNNENNEDNNENNNENNKNNDNENNFNIENIKSIKKLYKNISLKCHPDKTNNILYNNFYKEISKLYKNSKLIEFIAFYYLNNNVVKDIINNSIDFNDIELINIITIDLENYMREIYYMQNTNAWKWYYGDEFKKIEVLNDIKTQINLNIISDDEDNVEVKNNDDDISYQNIIDNEITNLNNNFNDNDLDNLILDKLTLDSIRVNNILSNVKF